jgi:hypothetical protein
MKKIFRIIEKVFCLVFLGVLWIPVLVTVTLVFVKGVSMLEDERAVYRMFFIGILTCPFVVWLGVILISKVNKGRILIWVINLMFFIFLLWFWIHQYLK